MAFPQRKEGQGTGTTKDFSGCWEWHATAAHRLECEVSQWLPVVMPRRKGCATDLFWCKDSEGEDVCARD